MIEEERRRVEELKRRVQDEVTAQWEQRRRQMQPGGTAGAVPDPSCPAGPDTETPAPERSVDGHRWETGRFILGSE